MAWIRLPLYFYKRNDTFYFSQSIPSDIQHRFKKRKIEVSLRTKSEAKPINLQQRCLIGLSAIGTAVDGDNLFS